MPKTRKRQRERKKGREKRSKGSVCVWVCVCVKEREGQKRGVIHFNLVGVSIERNISLHLWSIAKKCPMKVAKYVHFFNELEQEGTK